MLYTNRYSIKGLCMSDELSHTVSLADCQKMIMAFPCFAKLSETQYKDLATLAHEIHFGAREKIVIENELVDSIYIIVSGEAEVTREITHRKKILQVPVATLSAGEAIGLNDTGFYSS